MATLGALLWALVGAPSLAATNLEAVCFSVDLEALVEFLALVEFR